MAQARKQRPTSQIHACQSVPSSLLEFYPLRSLKKDLGKVRPAHTPLVHRGTNSLTPGQYGSAQRHWAPVGGSACNTRGQKSSDTWHSLFQQTTAECFPNPGPPHFEDQEASVFLGRGEKEINLLCPAPPPRSQGKPKAT